MDHIRHNTIQHLLLYLHNAYTYINVKCKVSCTQYDDKKRIAAKNLASDLIEILKRLFSLKNCASLYGFIVNSFCVFVDEIQIWLNFVFSFVGKQFFIGDDV